MHTTKAQTPIFLGKQIEFLDFKERFLDFSLGKPHQKFLKILSNAEVKEMGNKKVLIA